MGKEIPVYYNPSNQDHRPEYEFYNCERRPHPDIPQRSEKILEALAQSGIADIQISRIDEVLPSISLVHDADYLKYLEDTSLYAGKQAVKRGDPGYAVYPSVHPYTDYARASNGISRRGLYVFDTYTPISQHTFRVALDSAGVALAGAMLLREGEPLVYALTRPSGHHAQKAMTGGMCYMNNVAIAANYLRRSGADKVAILDIDLHHGNGTQDIFYDRPDVFVVNINADPRYKFPHFTGYSEERGIDEGVGANVNFPLPPGTGNEEYDETVQRALGMIRNFQPECLLISAGFDTHELDSVGGFKLTTSYYQQLGREIARLDTPILVVQEGGYAVDVLGDNVVSFLKGLIRK